MPNWKKLVVSGSDATLNSLNVITSITASDFVVNNSFQGNNISSSYIDLAVLANGDIPAHRPGRIFFGAEDGALEVYNEEADITLQVGQEFWARVFNPTTSSILNGTPVRASGSQGDRIAVYPALAEDHTTGPVFDNHILGVATHTIEGNTEGYVTVQGIVRGIDTSNFTAGDIVYLQTGSAGLRNTPPPFPYDIVQVGYVARAQANGFLFVEPKEPVHFSNISGLSGSYTADVGDLWVYQSNNAWTHSNILPNIIASGSFSGSFEGEGSGITGVISSSYASTASTATTATSASYAVSSSYSSNANLLDGINSTQFLRNDQNGTLLGNLQITGSLDVTGTITATSFTGSIGIGDSDTLSIGSQIFYPQGTNGFSVNEDFDPSNSSLQTAYHFTSGVGRETVAFTLARTNQFTDGFGIYGTAADNTFVMFGEQNNTSFEWRRGVGIRPLDLDGGTLLARLNTAGQFSAISISASNGITGSFQGDGSGLTGLVAALEVTGSIDSLTDAFASTSSVSLGTGSLGVNGVTGSFMTAVGLLSLGKSQKITGNLQTGLDSIGVGYKAGYSGSYQSISIGNYTSNSGSVKWGVNIGHRAGERGGNSSSILMGREAGQRGSHNNSVLIGDRVKKYTNSTRDIIIGSTAYDTQFAADSTDNVILGHSALLYLTTGSRNVVIGSNAGATTGAVGSSGYVRGPKNSTYIGYNVRPATQNDDNAIIIGSLAQGRGNNTTVIGTTSTTSATIYGTISGSTFSGSFVGNGSGLTNILSSSYAVTASYVDPGVTSYREVLSGNSTYTITHNLNEDFPIVQVYDSTRKQVIPSEITSTDTNNIQLDFVSTFSGSVVIKI